MIVKFAGELFDHNLKNNFVVRENLYKTRKNRIILVKCDCNTVVSPMTLRELNYLKKINIEVEGELTEEKFFGHFVVKAYLVKVIK